MLFFILIMFLGIIGNFFVLRVIFILKKRNFNDYFILNLVVIDIGICFVSILLDVVEKMKGEFFYGVIFCYVIYFF